MQHPLHPDLFLCISRIQHIQILPVERLLDEPLDNALILIRCDTCSFVDI